MFRANYEFLVAQSQTWLITKLDPDIKFVNMLSRVGKNQIKTTEVRDHTHL